MTNIYAPSLEDSDDSGLPYRITVKAAHPAWREKNTCILPISLGHGYHEGEKLESLFYWANKRFDNLVINLGDTLHRHNLMKIGHESESAFRESLMLGDQWLERNQPLMGRQITKPCRLTRWADWILNPAYNDLEKEIQSHFDNTEAFRDAVQSDITRFTIRQTTDNATMISNDITCSKSVSYLLEEATVNILMCRAYQAVRAYPADDMNCFQYLSAASLPPAIQGLEQSIRVNVKFKRKPSFALLPTEQAA